MKKEATHETHKDLGVLMLQDSDTWLRWLGQNYQQQEGQVYHPKIRKKK